MLSPGGFCVFRQYPGTISIHFPVVICQLQHPFRLDPDVIGLIEPVACGHGKISLERPEVAGDLECQVDQGCRFDIIHGSFCDPGKRSLRLPGVMHEIDDIGFAFHILEADQEGMPVQFRAGHDRGMHRVIIERGVIIRPDSLVIGLQLDLVAIITSFRVESQLQWGTTLFGNEPLTSRPLAGVLAPVVRVAGFEQPGYLLGRVTSPVAVGQHAHRQSARRADQVTEQIAVLVDERGPEFLQQVSNPGVAAESRLGHVFGQVQTADPAGLVLSPGDLDPMQIVGFGRATGTADQVRCRISVNR